MSRLFKVFIKPPIPNTGSVARDHLANERTFLSWTRTGLGFVALGVALAKLDALEALSPVTQLSRAQDATRTQGGLSSQGSTQTAENDTSSDLSEMGLPAAALVASGTGCLGYGTVRYYSSAMLLQKSSFRVNFWGVGLVAVTSAVVAGGGAMLVLREEMARGRRWLWQESRKSK